VKKLKKGGDPPLPGEAVRTKPTYDDYNRGGASHPL
jgi:hypothetical protein